MVVASDQAKFGLPEVKRGLFAAGGGMQLGRRVPIGFAMELALTGDTIDAERAAAMGLVNIVVPPERVLDEAVALAERIAANGPLGIAATKRIMRVAFNDGPAAGWELQSELHQSVFGSEDAKEGALAFIERRPAVFRGR
jgi:enoyl-CoA hydratase/carnithine racemase